MMKAVILAGGYGTRLEKLTLNIPKGLIKIGDKPILEHQIIFLRNSGIKDISILLGYLGYKMKDYFKTGKQWGVKIDYYQEVVPLGTAGALKQLEKVMKKDFLVLMGDIMLNIDIGMFINFHQIKKGGASIIIHTTDHPLDSDLVQINGDNQVLSFFTKPHSKSVNLKSPANASVYILSPKLFKYMEPNCKLNLESDVFPNMLKNGIKIYGFKTNQYLKDMGTIQRLKKVSLDYLSGKIDKSRNEI